MLKESEANSNFKDFEIQRLTRELVGLRLEHAQCIKRISTTEKDTDDNAIYLTTPSLADSGHFDDLSYHASQSVKDPLVEKDIHLLLPGGWAAEKNRMEITHAEKVEDLIRQHTDEVFIENYIIKSNN